MNRGVADVAVDPGGDAVGRGVWLDVARGLRSQCEKSLREDHGLERACV